MTIAFQTGVVMQFVPLNISDSWPILERHTLFNINVDLHTFHYPSTKDALSDLSEPIHIKMMACRYFTIIHETASLGCGSAI